MNQIPSKKAQVREAAWQFLEETGKVPSVRELQESLGGGSLRDISAELKAWQGELADWLHHQRHRPEVPDVLWEGLQTIWDAALESSRQAVEAEYATRRAEADKAIEEAAAEKAVVQKAVSEAQAAEAALAQRLAEATEALEQTRARLTETSEGRTAAERELALAQQRVTALDAQRTQLQETLEQQAEAHRDALAALRNDHAQMLQHLEAQQTVERNRLMREIDTLRQSLAEMQGKASQLSDALSEARADLRGEKAARESAEAQIAQLNDTLSACREEAKVAQTAQADALEKLRKENASCVLALAKAQEESLNLSRERDALAERTEALALRCEALASDKARLEGRLESLESETSNNKE